MLRPVLVTMLCASVASAQSASSPAAPPSDAPITAKAPRQLVVLGSFDDLVNFVKDDEVLRLKAMALRERNTTATVLTYVGGAGGLGLALFGMVALPKTGCVGSACATSGFFHPIVPIGLVVGLASSITALIVMPKQNELTDLLNLYNERQAGEAAVARDAAAANDL